MIDQFFWHLIPVTWGKMAAHVDEAERSVLVVSQACEGLDGCDGIVAGNLACLLEGNSLELRWCHGDGPVLG